MICYTVLFPLSYRDLFESLKFILLVYRCLFLVQLQLLDHELMHSIIPTLPQLGILYIIETIFGTF